MKENNLYPAYRDGLEMWTRGEVFTAPGGEVIEILYDKDGNSKTYFAELLGVPGCAHGKTVLEAIEEAKFKRDGYTLTEDEKKKYSKENYKFSVLLFRRITLACREGIDLWLNERGLDWTVEMTIPELHKAGGGAWARILEEKVRGETSRHE